MSETEKQIEKYQEHIMKKLRKRITLDENDTSEDEFLLNYSKSQVFSEVLRWDGY